MDPINSLSLDEQECLHRYRAQAAQATPGPHTNERGTHLSLGLTMTTPTQALPFSAPFALPRPIERGSSTASIASASTPAERPTQRRAIKRRRGALESGTEDNSVDSPHGHEVPGDPLDPLDPLLDTLKDLHEGIAKPQPRFIVSEASGGGRVEDLTHLFAGHNALVSHLLVVIDEMASRIKELEKADRSDVQRRHGIPARAERRKKMKAERTPPEQRIADLVKVRTINHIDTSYLM